MSKDINIEKSDLREVSCDFSAPEYMDLKPRPGRRIVRPAARWATAHLAEQFRKKLGLLAKCGGDGPGDLRIDTGDPDRWNNSRIWQKPDFQGDG